ncbi:ribonuclease III, partial [Candidatus Parcubacteria bacterium]|nr:ribonuclease III [Candidatus Parcubacteria bacterium]
KERITNFLYKRFRDMNEGELTSLRSALVNADTCALVAQKLEANNFLLLSKGESKDAGRARQYILANTLEAVIGAIYLDQGFEEAEKFILTHITSLADEIIASGAWIDAKSLFQAEAQEHESITPSYKTIKESGPDHDKHFTVGVYLDRALIGEGEGKSKQDAEQEAARSALKAKGWEK